MIFKWCRIGLKRNGYTTEEKKIKQKIIKTVITSTAQSSGLKIYWKTKAIIWTLWNIWCRSMQTNFNYLVHKQTNYHSQKMFPFIHSIQFYWLYRLWQENNRWSWRFVLVLFIIYPVDGLWWLLLMISNTKI